MLTEFGKICRKIRIDHGQILLDMANSLNVTPAYLSAVETGKRNVPDEWPHILSETYDLSEEQYKELIEAAYYSKKEVKINLESMEELGKEMVLAFARKLDSMDSIEKQKILKILKK